MYALDSLKQLATKFLEKVELANYHFQKEFLKPFEIVMAKNLSPKIRDMVVGCLSLMVQAKANNIKSGWKSVFVVTTLSAADKEGSVFYEKNDGYFYRLYL
jgi:brefeldin A-inhibited guanine nucleotide-exchange protein